MWRQSSPNSTLIWRHFREAPHIARDSLKKRALSIKDFIIRDHADVFALPRCVQCVEVFYVPRATDQYGSRLRAGFRWRAGGRFAADAARAVQPRAIHFLSCAVDASAAGST